MPPPFGSDQKCLCCVFVISDEELLVTLRTTDFKSLLLYNYTYEDCIYIFFLL